MAEKKKKKSIMDMMSLVLFILSVAFIAFSVGAVSVMLDYIPKDFLSKTKTDIEEIKAPADGFVKVNVEGRNPEKLRKSPGHTPGLRLMCTVDEELYLRAVVMDENAEIFHEWIIDFRDITDDWTYLPEHYRPYSRPGGVIHGAEVYQGDLIFVFEHRGLARINQEGEIVWHADGLQAHHSIEKNYRDNYWVSTQKMRYYSEENQKLFPDRKFPLYEFTVTEITPDGDVIDTISMRDVITQNGLNYLYLMRQNNVIYSLDSEDYLHCNDVEEFPDHLEPDYFGPGDLMVSARNINTILVFNKDTLEIKHVWTGPFVHQHDPDFIDGNRISVYDNFTIGPPANGHHSRILIMDAKNDRWETYYEGNDEEKFNATLMGKHQWLENGNLFINEARVGRGFEITPEGEIVWEYYNLTNPAEAYITPTFHLISEEQAQYFIE